VKPPIFGGFLNTVNGAAVSPGRIMDDWLNGISH